MVGYWLSEWLDSEGVADVQVVRGVLRTNRGYDRLIEAAENAARAELPSLPQGTQSIVAGTGLDLSGVMSCSRPDCIKGVADKLIMRSWHFFDNALVCGLDPTNVVFNALDGESDYVRQRVLDHVQVILHLRDIGAEEFFAFSRRPHICAKNFEQHAAEVGLPTIAKLKKRLERELYQACEIESEEVDHGLAYVYDHPALDYSAYGLIPVEEKSSKPLKKVLSAHESDRLIAAHVMDVWMSRRAGAALGQVTRTDGRLVSLRRTEDEPTVADVAFNIQLPVIRGARPADLLDLRGKDGSEFEVFRSALRKAIEERLKALPDANAKKIGDAVISDVVRPALAAIDTRVKRSTTLLAKRTGVALTVGAATTTVGLLAFAPLTTPGLILAAGGMVATYNDYLNDRRDIDLSDMHFLWRMSSRHS